MKLPYFECPIPSAIHPGAAHADAQSVAWMRRFSLCLNDTERDRMARSGCGELAARIVPDATPQTLQILSDFFIWNVSFDDEYCDEGPLSRQPGRLAGVLAMIHRAIETPEDSAQVDDRYAAAMCDIRRRLDAHATADQMAQWLAAMRGWFFAEVWKAGNVASGHVPSLNQYGLLRLYSGGGLAFPTLAAIAEGYAVPTDLLEDRRVRALAEMALTLATWSADIVSYEKEVAREQGGHNLISVIQHGSRMLARGGRRTGRRHVHGDHGALPGPARRAHRRRHLARAATPCAKPGPHRQGHVRLVPRLRALRAGRRARRSRAAGRPCAEGGIHCVRHPVHRLVVDARPRGARSPPGHAGPARRRPG
ncbi:hypothetical protein ACFJIS_11880 [Variovorax boronicumulans]|uniref:terpene synthase family protein n=1 Tax=Variovorax boronicumulans TaxID=436515 RepID=UPI0036F3575F